MSDLKIQQALLAECDTLQKTTIGVPEKTTTIIKTGWTPNTCREIALLFKFPTKIQLPTTQFSVVRRFFKFYITGHVPDECDTVDLVLSAASLVFSPDATISKDLVWTEEMFSAGGPHLFSLSAAKAEEPDKVPSEKEIEDVFGPDTGTGIETPTLLKIISKQDPTTAAVRPETDETTLFTKSKHLMKIYQPDDLAKFSLALATRLASVDASAAPKKSILMVYKMAGFLALTMLRSVVKTRAQMTAGFAKAQYLQNLSNLIGGDLISSFSTPCSEALDAVCLSIKKNEKRVSSFMAHIVYSWNLNLRTRSEISAVYAATVLTHSSWNGMGIIEMIYEASRLYNTPWVTIMQNTLMSPTTHTWTLVKEFMQNHQKINEPDLTVTWARVIDDGYFTGMNCERHHTLAALLISCVRADQEDDGILDSVWAKKHRTTITFYVEAAEYLLEVLSGVTTEITAVSAEAKELIKHIGKRQQQPQPEAVPLDLMMQGLEDDL